LQNYRMSYITGSKRYIVTNFAYGTGPYLRTADLAVAFNDEIERQGESRFGVIVPWIYGERQRRVMLEHFASHVRNNPREILLDERLGLLYKKVFYGTHTYEEALRKWTDESLVVSQEATHYLRGDLVVETLGGEKVNIKGQSIALELARSPRLAFAVVPAYFTSFAYIEDILDRAQGEADIAVPMKLLKKGKEVARSVEEKYTSHCIAYPATFAYLGKQSLKYSDEIVVPPIAPLPKIDEKAKINRGIYVTVTGIPGLERLYREAAELGLQLYSNFPDSVPGSLGATPECIGHKNILLHFARAGWSSIWHSLCTATPLIVPRHDPKDDPEIFFNNACVDHLGIAKIYEGQSLQELLRSSDGLRQKSTALTEAVIKKFGTFDGNSYCAELFAKDFLKRYK